jgi:hypothetical protein
LEVRAMAPAHGENGNGKTTGALLRERITP